MANTQCIEPIVGDWYHSHGHLFEVVAVDDDERIIELQHADGDLEEIDFDDWFTRCRAGSLAMADPPEDSSFAEDRQDHDDAGVMPATIDQIGGVRAEAMSDLDLFE
jgi:hypothetical protein